MAVATDWEWVFSDGETRKVVAKAKRRFLESKSHSRSFDPNLGKKHLRSLYSEEAVAHLVGASVAALHAADGRPDFEVETGRGLTAIEVVSAKENFRPVPPEFIVNSWTLARCAKRVETVGYVGGIVFVFLTIANAPDLDENGDPVEDDDEDRLFETETPLVVARLRGHAFYAEVEALEPRPGLHPLRYVPPDVLHPSIPWRAVC